MTRRPRSERIRIADEAQRAEAPCLRAELMRTLRQHTEADLAVVGGDTVAELLALGLTPNQAVGACVGVKHRPPSTAVDALRDLHAALLPRIAQARTDDRRRGRTHTGYTTEDAEPSVVHAVAGRLLWWALLAVGQWPDAATSADGAASVLCRATQGGSSTPYYLANGSAIGLFDLDVALPNTTVNLIPELVVSGLGLGEAALVVARISRLGG